MLLRSDPGQAHRGMVAKVADFGLSVAVDQAQTHVSAMRQVSFGGGGGVGGGGGGGLGVCTYYTRPRAMLLCRGRICTRMAPYNSGIASGTRPTHTDPASHTLPAGHTNPHGSLLHTHSLQGTQTHMAPETLLRSQQGKASDV